MRQTAEIKDNYYYSGDKLIKDKYTFVTYNSVTAVKQIEDIGSLNNKVIIVDEVHNLATRMVNGLRGTGKQGYELYKHLFNAKNSKIVFLTGTPLVNTPFEIAVLFNILRGPIEVIAFRISNFSEETIDNYIAELIKNERIGWVELERRNQSLLVIMKLNSWDMEFEQTIRFIEFTARKYDAYVNYERTDSYPLFPETEEEFETRHAGLCKKSKSGKSSAKRSMPETDEDFATRLDNWYENNDTMTRQELMFGNDDYLELEESVWEFTQQLLDCKRRKVWYNNPTACEKWGRMCQYYKICSAKNKEMVIENLYEVKPVHSELEQKELELF